MTRSKIIVVLTGSLACYQACELIHRLLKAGHTVRAIATPAALRFVGRPTLEGLTGWSVLEHLWEMGEAIDHLHLSQWADAVVVCPATVDTLIRLSDCAGDDLLASLRRIHPASKPWLMIPAISRKNWRQPSLARAVAKLARGGVRLIAPPSSAAHPGGHEDEELMASTAAIFGNLEAALARPSRRLRLLITSGCPAETFGGLRLLADSDAGHLGADLAGAFFRAGHEVLLLCTRESAASAPPCQRQSYATFAQLDHLLRAALDHLDFDAVLHAAPISDFTIEAVASQGADSGARPGREHRACATLHLRRSAREMERLRAWSHNPCMSVVAFNLLHNSSEAEALRSVDRLFECAAVDYVVHREAGKIHDEEGFPLRVFRAGRRAVSRCTNVDQLALTLERALYGPAPASPAVASTRVTLDWPEAGRNSPPMSEEDHPFATQRAAAPSLPG